MDKQEMLSNIQKIESEKVKYPSGNTAFDAVRRLQFVNDVLNFLDTAFTKGLYHVENWKSKIGKSLSPDNSILGYSWPQTEASYVLLKIKELLIQVDTIPSYELPTCHHSVSMPTPHENNTEQNQHNIEKIVAHTASTILHAGSFLHVQYTYNFYNEIVTKFESEQRILHRQLTPYECRLLNWAREEREHAIHARLEDGFKAVTHGAQSIVEAIDDSCRY